MAERIRPADSPTAERIQRRMPQPTPPEIFLATDPAGLAGSLLALWYAGKGEWRRAHEVAQSGKDRDSAWVHAYLHRREGDQGNAEYWYRRAGRPVFRAGLEEEWAVMLQELRSQSTTSPARMSGSAFGPDAL